VGDWRDRDRSGGDWPAGWNEPVRLPAGPHVTEGKHRPGHHRATAEQVREASRRAAPDADRRHWWLLLPVVLSLATPLYNRAGPHLFGMPFFYWFQLSLAAFASVVMALVHLTTRKHP
jgi:hypothetical protein